MKLMNISFRLGANVLKQKRRKLKKRTRFSMETFMQQLMSKFRAH